MTLTSPVRVVRIIRGRYTDSVVLMRLADTLGRERDVSTVTAVMATPANKQMLVGHGWSTTEFADADPDDIIVAVSAATRDVATAALDRVPQLLDQGLGSDERSQAHTLSDALRVQPTSNVVSISLPGEYAAAEARAAIEAGLHVFLFSSNVSVEDEVLLKKAADQHGMLCMGPDCGTAIIAGRGLGFANAVRRGPVGVIGAAGTGIQAITTTLDRLGVGVSHAIGVGGRDLTDTVGGLTTHAALRALIDDPQTEAIIVVSKPPDPAQAARLRAAAAGAHKPVITCLLGDPHTDATTLADAAIAAARAVGAGDATACVVQTPVPPLHRAGHVRGLFTGGTLAYEAHLVLARHGVEAPVVTTLEGVASPHLVDLGSAVLTVGRAHPMIDPRLRGEAIATAVADPSVGVVLVDVVLGYNAHPDPAGALVQAIAEAARNVAPEVLPAFVASVVGTDRDPQNATEQVRTLEAAGVVVLPTTAAAAEAAAELTRGGTR